MMSADRRGVSLVGAVDCPLEMRFGHAEVLGLKDHTAKIICASGRDREVAGSGVDIEDVFSLALARETARSACFKSADGYEDTVPLAELVLRRAYLLYEDPSSLPRLVIPGRVGARWVKEISEIELA
jgi:DMSO/TMAO reductase YedYZ molybdopterin-dependent catalytic subunit